MDHEQAQNPHSDYSWRVLRRYENKLFVAFWPLSQDGCQLQVWTTPDIPSLDDNRNRQQPGVVVSIPYGSFLLLHGASVHGGGFASNLVSGNVRMQCHLFPTKLDLARDGDLKNEYCFEGTTSQYLSEVFVDGSM